MDSESRLASGVYAKRDIVIARGKDATLWDKQGRAYIDCVSGRGVARWAMPTKRLPALFMNRRRP